MNIRRQRLFQISLTALLIVSALLACSLGNWLNPESELSPWGRATLTFAAGEWYAQQTAIATMAILPVESPLPR